MDLECLQGHMRGQKVLVNGNLYTVGADGIAKGVKDADAPKLLASKVCWRKVATTPAELPQTPVKPPAVAAPVESLTAPATIELPSVPPPASTQPKRKKV
jgi:hypothetical protein